MSTTTDSSPEPHLPLKPVVHQILLALAEGPSHGYGVIRTIRDRTDGRTRLRTGPLYRHLSRLLDTGLVAEAEERPPDDDPRRGTYYRLTPLGRQVVRAEAIRQANLVSRTHRLGLMAGDGGP